MCKELSLVISCFEEFLSIILCIANFREYFVNYLLCGDFLWIISSIEFLLMISCLKNFWLIFSYRIGSCDLSREWRTLDELYHMG